MRNDELRKTFKKYLRRAGYTQKEFAPFVGASESALSRWVNRQSPWPEDALELTCEHLELSPSEAADFFSLARKTDKSLAIVRPLEAPNRISTSHPQSDQLEPIDFFIGRENELKRLLTDLQPDRVVTLCGPGGVGKTALVIQAIRELVSSDTLSPRFPDGVFWYTFQEQQPQVTLALEEIARVFGENPREGTPEIAAKLALSGKRALLVLDSAEHADNLQKLLAVRGQCGVLITTRRKEDAPTRLYRQDITTLPLDEAIKLLQAWGGPRATDEVAVGLICELVGKLPLALRIAGRYMNYTEQNASEFLALLEKTRLQILDRGQRPNESIPILLEASFAQVSEGAQQALAVVGMLAPFPFEREVIAAALEISAPKVSELLGELINYSLLERPEEHYKVTHALIHTYSQKRLAVPDIVMKRLVAYYTALAEEQNKLGLAGYARLDIERPHIVLTLIRSVGGVNYRELRQLAWAIKDYLDKQGHWFQHFLIGVLMESEAKKFGNRQDQIFWLSSIGWDFREVGQAEAAIGYLTEALAIAQKIGDRHSEATILNRLGITYNDLGTAYKDIEKSKQAKQYYEKALTIAQKIGDRHIESGTLCNLGSIYRRDMKQLEMAIGYYERALAIAKESSGQHTKAVVLAELGHTQRELKQPETAIEYYKKSLAIIRELGDRRLEGIVLANLGMTYQELGQINEARKYLSEAQTILSEVSPPYAVFIQGYLDELKVKEKSSKRKGT